MSAATISTRRRMGITTLISAIFIVSTLVWATYNFAIVQSGAVRQYTPHYPYGDIPYWPYDNDFVGGRTNWFENINYTNIPLDMDLPEDLLGNLDDIIFTVVPANPPQLWRIGAYDDYDGTNWGKTIIGTRTLDSDTQLITYSEATNPVYTVIFNATAGATVGAMEIPSLFPDIRVIEDSFLTWSVDATGNPYPDPSRLLDYDLDTDAYGTLLFSPLIQGTTGEEVVVTFDLTYETQDLNNVRTNALLTVPGGYDNYLTYPSLSQRVIDNITQFQSVGNDAYEKAMAVQLYFQSTFEVRVDAAALTDRPDGQEVTDWFLERGGGLPMDFATAYCVFMRYLGVPARLAMGYAVGDPDSTFSYREVKVRHMTFWSEVFIPMSASSTGGEWIQVIPAMLPSDMGGAEDPTNTPTPNVQLLVWPTSGQPWAQIGVPFDLSAAITIDGVPVTTPEIITFYDETDSVYIGSAAIPPSPPIATVTHAFPAGASIDYHIISATWTTSTYSIANRTSIYCVGNPNPFSHQIPSTESGGFVLSETRELNVSQGVDTHFAFWEDTIHVYGTIKVGGVPVNSSKHDNTNIGIYWDNSFMGNATFDEYGYYELNIYVDPIDLSRMTIGAHEVWAWYLGDWDQYGVPRLLPARSSNNSTVTVWGRVGFDLYVYPTDLSPGETVYYDGIAYLLNGTLLPMGQQVGVFFGSQANTTLGLNSTGGFTWSYLIPITQPEGTYFAYANWTSPWSLIAGNWSVFIPVNVGSSGTQLSINPLPDPLYIGMNITISGYLTHVSNGTGIGGRWVDIYWNNGSTFLLGSALTASDGYYELNYTILISDEGPIEYWSSFTSIEPTLTSSESTHLFTNVKKLDISLDPISITPDPVFLLQPVDIQGVLQLSEFAYPLPNEWVDFWLQNSTGVFYIGSDMTNSTGGYFYQYTIPISQTTEIVYIWANYSSPYYNVYDGESVHEPLDIQATGTLISIQEDFSIYYLNETILLYGNLQFSNGTPIQFETVYIHWYNASGTFLFTKTTDAFGYYQMFYNCTPVKDEPGLIDVYVNWTSWTPIYDDAFSSIAPLIQLQRYYLEIALNVPSQLYVDETAFDIEGVLTYLGGAPPLAGETVYISWWDGAGWYELDNPVTNSTGGFLTSLGFVGYDEGIYYFRVQYISSNPLNNDTVAYFDITRIKYAINLDVTINPNPVMQNETLTVHVYAYFSHNGTALSGATISIFWNNGTLPLPFLGNIITNLTGQGDLYYSGMSWDTVRTGIEVYGVYSGTIFRASNESVHNILTLSQWQTTFTGVNLPVVLYRLGETIVVTGNLEYVFPSNPYAGATVLLGLPIWGTMTTDVTASDGSFTLSWDIPGNFPPGFHNLIIDFNSPYPWITDALFNLPQIEVIAPGYLWPEFTVTPTTIYLDQVLNITGRVTWDNGTSYANSPVDFYWGDYFGVNSPFVIDFLTDGNGRFSYLYPIPDDLGLVGVREVWAYIDPIGYATFGVSPRIPILIDLYSVAITAIVDSTTVYLGGSLTFSGTLQLTDGTPLVGYDIEIWWGGSHLTTITISDPVAGAFNYVHSISYSNAIGVISGYALFTPPSIAWGVTDTTEFFEDVTVIERVDVFLDTQPIDNTVSRGDTLVVTGYVRNDGGFLADGVRVEVLVDGGGTGSTDITAADGRYSISLQVLGNQPPGSYIISVRVTLSFHELRNGPIAWTILVYIDSDVYVQTNQLSLMPGESLSVIVQLNDDDGTPLNGEWVSLYLGSTYVMDVYLTDARGESFDLVVPLSWAEGDGYFDVMAEYDGMLYINPSSDVSTESIHVFNSPVFLATPSRVDPGLSFNIVVTIQDSEGNPIRSRQIQLNYNGTDVFPYVTDSDGRFSHSVAAQADGAIINFRVTLLSLEVGNIQSNTFTINIQPGDNPLQGTDLIIAGILLVGAVVAVLAYLYIVKGMFRSPVISRGIDIPTKLRNIKKLADSGKYGASITLAYRTFEQMCGTKMGSERTHSETAREYLDRILQAIPLDAVTVERFVQTYEEARFSHHEMTRERYEEAVRIFTDLYPRIDSSAPVE